MTTASHLGPGSLRQAFLVERYLSPAAAESLPASVSRAARLSDASAESGAASPVHYLNSVYLPSDDSCFCLFLAATADAVCALNADAGFALDRVTPAVLLHSAGLLPNRKKEGT